MAVLHYFNSMGEWIAFRRHRDDHFLFDKHGNWVGWFPWHDNDAVDTKGNYLGTVVEGDRFYRRIAYQPVKGKPGYPGYPGHVGYAGYPGHAAYRSPPPGYQDVIFPWMYSERRA